MIVQKGNTIHRNIEFNDTAAGGATDAGKILADIQSAVGDIRPRLAALEARKPEVNSADVATMTATLTAMAGRLDTVEKRNPELNALTDSLKKQIEGVERKVNDLGVTSPASGKASPRKRFAEMNDLDAAMRGGREIERNALNPDLFATTVIFDSPLTGEYPLVDMALRSTAAAPVRIGFYTSAMVGTKDGPSPVQGDWIPVKLDPKENYYKPKLLSLDVTLVGAALLDSEMIVAMDGFAAKMNDDMVAAVVAARLPASDAAFDPLKKIELLDTTGTATWTSGDIDRMISALGKRYRRGAVFVGNSLMTAVLMSLVDPTTKAPLWVPSLAQGVPATLRGYQYVEDEGMPNDSLAFGNVRRGCAINESKTPGLVNIERFSGDYLPYFNHGVSVGVLDPRAWKTMKKKSA